MKTVTKTMVAMAILLTGAFASANEVEVPAWICALNFHGTNKSAQVFIGKSEFKGQGTVRCVSASNDRVEYPVKVTMKTKPLAPNIGIGKMDLYGEALQIALTSTNPQALLGKYLVAEARAAVGVGAGALVAVRADEEALSLSVSLQLIKGVGFDIGFRKMIIELDTTRLDNPTTTEQLN